MTAYGTFRSWRCAWLESASGPKTDIDQRRFKPPDRSPAKVVEPAKDPTFAAEHGRPRWRIRKLACNLAQARSVADPTGKSLGQFLDPSV